MNPDFFTHGVLPTLKTSHVGSISALKFKLNGVDAAGNLSFKFYLGLGCMSSHFIRLTTRMGNGSMMRMRLQEILRPWSNAALWKMVLSTMAVQMIGVSDIMSQLEKVLHTYASTKLFYSSAWKQENLCVNVMVFVLIYTWKSSQIEIRQTIKWTISHHA